MYRLTCEGVTIFCGTQASLLGWIEFALEKGYAPTITYQPSEEVTP